MSYCDIPHGDTFETRLPALLNEAYKPLSMQACILESILRSHQCEVTSRLLIDVMRATGQSLIVATKITHTAAREDFVLVDLYKDPNAQVQGCWAVACPISVNYERNVFCVGHREGTYYFAMEFDGAVAIYVYDQSGTYPELKNIGLVKDTDTQPSTVGFKTDPKAVLWAAKRFKMLNLAHATPRTQNA